MPTIVYVRADGRRMSVAGEVGVSLMEAALNADVEGILGECGGACSCATCHIYIREPWRDRVTPPDEMELDMLEAAAERRPESRLGCQIRLVAELDGIEIGLPERQELA